MKKTLLSIFLILTIITYLTAQKVRIAGSDTMLPLSQMEAYEFMQRNIDASLIITGGGSAIGIASLLDNRAEIAQSARELTKSERNSFKKKEPCDCRALFYCLHPRPTDRFPQASTVVFGVGGV